MIKREGERDTYGWIGRTCGPKKPKGLVMLLFKPSKSVVKIAYAAGNQSPMDCFIAQTVRVFFDPEISRGEKLALLSSKLLAHLLVIVAAPAIELNGYLKLQRSSMATCPTPNMTTMP